MQESDVVGEGLGVELRVHDDVVDEHVSMGVQGGVLGRREVQLAQTRDEVSEGAGEGGYHGGRRKAISETKRLMLISERDGMVNDAKQKKIW